MLGYEELMNSLDQIDEIINGDQNLMVRALGLLLLGEDVSKIVSENNKDPTDTILSNGLRTPEF